MRRADRRRRRSAARRGWLLAGLLVAASSAAADPPEAPVDVAFKPALQGFVRNGGFAEIGVRLAARRDGEARIEITGTDAVYAASVALRAGEARSLWLPYRADPARRVRARVLFGGVPVDMGDRWTIRPTPARTPAVFAASAGSGFPEPSVPTGAPVIRLGPGDLPRTLHGYEPVSALVLDVSVLTRLDGRQLTALQDYIGDCGRLTAVDLPERVKPKIRRLAGCGGAFVTFADRAGQAGDLVAGATGAAKPPLPSAADLHALNPDAPDGGPMLSVSVLLAAYGALMVLAALAGRAVPALLLPAGTAVLALALWTGRTPGVSAILWLDAAEGQTTARFATLVQVEGYGRGEAVVSLPAGARPDPLPTGARYQRTADGADEDAVSVTVPARLLSRTTLRTTGSVSLRDLVQNPETGAGLAAGDAVERPNARAFAVRDGQGYGLDTRRRNAGRPMEGGQPTPLPSGLRRVIGQSSGIVVVYDSTEPPLPLLRGIDAAQIWRFTRPGVSLEPRP